MPPVLPTRVRGRRGRRSARGRRGIRGVRAGRGRVLRGGRAQDNNTEIDDIESPNKFEVDSEDKASIVVSLPVRPIY